MKTILTAGLLALMSTAASAEWVAAQDVVSFKKPYSRLPSTVIGVYKTKGECLVAMHRSSWALMATGEYENWESWGTEINITFFSNDYHLNFKCTEVD